MYNNYLSWKLAEGRCFFVMLASTLIWLFSSPIAAVRLFNSIVKINQERGIEISFLCIYYCEAWQLRYRRHRMSSADFSLISMWLWSELSKTIRANTDLFQQWPSLRNRSHLVEYRNQTGSRIFLFWWTCRLPVLITLTDELLYIDAEKKQLQKVLENRWSLRERTPCWIVPLQREDFILNSFIFITGIGEDLSWAILFRKNQE